MSGQRRTLFVRQGLLGLGAVVVVPLLVQKSDGLADGVPWAEPLPFLMPLPVHCGGKPLNPSEDVSNGNARIDLSAEGIKGQFLWIRGRTARRVHAPKFLESRTDRINRILFSFISFILICPAAVPLGILRY